MLLENVILLYSLVLFLGILNLVSNYLRIVVFHTAIRLLIIIIFFHDPLYKIITLIFRN